MTRRQEDPARARRRAYLQHVYRCRRGCNRVARRYCPSGAQLRAGYELALGEPTAPRQTGCRPQEATA
ncbi:hypothetical protein [Streptomyces sp. MJP52]|uniref:hypothetical protein n=1 Tax=Streptomyces sp. MJP52 TaxID=2940555 RepID=UPI00247647BE|nr:hypothetical protein [Streptomyces sp. MJP52]MDH6226192.1 hypothetical protein [Streptomyces sp. MJP52]